MSSANLVGIPAPVGSLGARLSGRYLVRGRLGAGGEGESFVAHDEVADRDVALKLFRAPAPAVERRVRGEFERLSGIDHPGVVRVVDLGRHAGHLFLVTELVVGERLATIADIADDERRCRRLVAAAVGLADALAYLHGRGIVHGDLSPDNVRLTSDGHPVLFDFAFPALVAPGAAIGTLGFAAPEALIGHAGPASDLFALGATLFAAWTGAGPFGTGLEAVPRTLTGAAPLLSNVRSGLPSGWDDLVAALLQPAAALRPSSARHVLMRLERLSPAGATEREGGLLPPFPGGDPLAGLFVGRESERATLRSALAQLADGAATHGVIAVVGAEGSGRRCLIESVLQDQKLAELGGTVEPLGVFRGSLSGLASWLKEGDSGGRGAAESRPQPVPEPGVDPERDLQRRFAELGAALELRARMRPLCVILEPGSAEIAFATFIAGAAPSGHVSVVLPVREPLGRVAALDLALGPLAPTEVAFLATRAAGEGLPASVLDALFEATGGHAATTAHVIRQLVHAVREGAVDRFQPRRDAGLEERLAASLATLSSQARRVLVSQALQEAGGVEPPGASSGNARPASTAAIDEARAAGWLVDEPGGDPALHSGAHAAVIMRALGAPDLRDLAASALGWLPDVDGRRGACLEALGRNDEAVAAFRAAAGVPGAHPGAAGARWLERAFILGRQCLDTAERIRLATQMAMEGRGADAEKVLAPLPGDDALAVAERLRLDERRAWLAARGGDLEAARRILARSIAGAATRGPTPEAPDDGLGGVLALSSARLARVLVGMHRFAEAVGAATPAFEDPVAGALAIESASLAHAYEGDVAAARALLATPQARTLAASRALYLVALADHLAGDLDRALAGYRQALARADVDGDIHTAAAIALNLGALAAEAGRFEEALAAQDRAIRELGRMGATAELGTALFNAGMLVVELADLTGARRLLERLRSELGRLPGVSDGAALYLEAEIASRSGADAPAIDGYARVAMAPGTSPQLVRAATLARIDVMARAGRVDEAAALLAPLLARGERGGEPDGGAEVRRARARILLASKLWDADAAAALADEVADDARAAAAAGRRAVAWRTGTIAARLYQRLDRVTSAARAAADARRLFEEVRMSTPVDHRPGVDQDPDARFFVELARLGGGDPEAAARAARNEGRLRRLLRINKRLNSELRLPRLLELIMDTVIELTEAERGFVLLEDEKGQLAVKVARNIDQQTLEAGAFELSRSIARQAATGMGPIVTIDAAGDPRFREAMSVSDLHLRSVLAVPLQIKGRAVGTIYVDNRLRKGAFDDDDVQLVLDFAEQAAIAIENARLLSELRKRERQIEILNRKLQGELDARKEELIGMKQELRENREALAIRYDYRNIVGRTPRMLELFRLLDRLTDTALPVVIQGESGTGKELVARALHFNGPRRQRPFVSENCAAIPETLLESTLFGAVRGAYTGADHDSRGLFEVADGGTLFLDEVGEMSPGMQGKLLRILQTGELRRVGAERTRTVDVRIIAATNRDLGRMVEEGRFRQDLFFRLSVARILLPPLRERREDIPAIAEHVLAKIVAKTMAKTAAKLPGAGSQPAGAPVRIAPEALARLCAYRWPGNVRELENEIMRALAFCRDVITLADLSPHIAGDAEAALTTLEDPDSLALRPRVERLERALLKEALSRSTGNQTKAAEALGLSRFGLQKKLRRYRMLDAATGK